MALPSTGSISMSQINTELGRAAGTNISLNTAEDGGYAAINQKSVAKPSSANPASMSEWRGYNHGCGQVGISGLTSGQICNGNTILLVATGGMTSYTWTIPGVGTVSSDTLQLQPGSAGYPAVNGTVAYTVVGTSTGCSSTATRSVTVRAVPSVTISPSSVTINQGQSTTLTASGAATYLWSTGATSASITVSPSSTTSFTVTGTSAEGCSAQNGRTVIVIAATTTTTTTAAPPEENYNTVDIHQEPYAESMEACIYGGEDNLTLFFEGSGGTPACPTSSVFVFTDSDLTQRFDGQESYWKSNQCGAAFLILKNEKKNGFIEGVIPC